MAKKVFLKYYPFLIFFALIFWWFFRDLYPRSMFAYGDRPPFPPSIGNAWWVFASAWKEQFPGLVLPSLNLYPFSELIFMILALGNPIIAQKLFFLFPFVLSFSLMYWFLGKIEIKSRFGRFLGGLIFSINLVGLGEVIGGAPGSLMATAFLPAIVWYSYRVFGKNKGQIPEILLLALFSFFAFIFSDHIVIFLAGFVLVFALFNLWGGNLSWGSFGKNVFLLGLFFALLSLSYIPLYWQLSRGVPAEGDASLKSLFADVVSSYAGFNFWSFISLGGGHFFEKIFGGKGWGYLTGIVPILALGGAVFSPPKKRFWVWFLMLITGTVTVFIYLTKVGALNFLFEKFPLLFRFRNAVRLQLLVGFCLASLVALFWENLEVKFSGKKWLFPLALVIFFIYLFAIEPLSFGQVLKAEKTIPSYYQEINDLVGQEKSKGFERTLYLPWDYEVQKRVLWENKTVNGLFLGMGQYEENSYRSFLEDFYKSMERGDLEAIKSGLVASKTGIIVIDKNRSDNGSGKISAGLVFSTPYLTGDTNRLKELIASTGLYETKKETDNFIIFETKQAPEINFFSDKISLYPQSPQNYFTILTDNKLDFKKNVYDLKDPKETAKIDKNQYSLLSTKKEIFIKWENPPPSGGKDFVLDTKISGLKSKMTFGPGTVFKFKLATQVLDTFARIGLWDVAGNGLWFDLGLRTGDSLPILRASAKNNNQDFTRDIVSRDNSQHSYKIAWEKEKISFFYEEKPVGEFKTALEANLPIQIGGSDREKLAIAEVFAETLEDHTIWEGKGSSSLLSNINWQIKNSGLNNYKIIVENAPPNFVLVFNHPYAPGWQAMVDGQKLPHFTANGIFNGFEVANFKGGEIEISYQPQKAHELLLALNGLILVLGGGAIFSLKKKDR